jgi:hypothetical protein
MEYSRSGGKVHQSTSTTAAAAAAAAAPATALAEASAEDDGSVAAVKRGGVGVGVAATTMAMSGEDDDTKYGDGFFRREEESTTSRLAAPRPTCDSSLREEGDCGDDDDDDDEEDDDDDDDDDDDGEDDDDDEEEDDDYFDDGKTMMTLSVEGEEEVEEDDERDREGGGIRRRHADCDDDDENDDENEGDHEEGDGDDQGTEDNKNGDDDVFWSIRSNVCFVAGGLIHLAGTSWDYAMYNNRPGTDDINDDNDDGPTSSPTYDPLEERWGYYVAYQLLWILGPSVYLLNSVIDVRWVLRTRRRERDRRHCLLSPQYRCEYNDDDVDDEYDDDCVCAWIARNDGRDGRGGGNGGGGGKIGRSGSRSKLSRRQRMHRVDRDVDDDRIVRPRLRRIETAVADSIAATMIRRSSRRYRRRGSNFLGDRAPAVFGGHRRELGAAFTFGVAASLGMIAALCRLFAEESTPLSMSVDDVGEEGVRVIPSSSGGVTEEDWWLPTALEGASVHIYLASAILALWRWPKPLPMSNDGKKDKHEIAVPWHSNVGSLETLGDGLFGVSSVVDVCLQDSNVDKIYWWSVISSLLWMADALLYLRADFVGLYRERRRLMT